MNANIDHFVKWLDKNGWKIAPQDASSPARWHLWEHCVDHECPSWCDQPPWLPRLSVRTMLGSQSCDEENRNDIEVRAER